MAGRSLQRYLLRVIRIGLAVHSDQSAKYATRCHLVNRHSMFNPIWFRLNFKFRRTPGSTNVTVCGPKKDKTFWTNCRDCSQVDGSWFMTINEIHSVNLSLWIKLAVSWTFVIVSTWLLSWIAMTRHWSRKHWGSLPIARHFPQIRILFEKPDSLAASPSW